MLTVDCRPSRCSAASASSEANGPAGKLAALSSRATSSGFLHANNKNCSVQLQILLRRKMNVNKTAFQPGG